MQSCALRLAPRRISVDLDCSVVDNMGRLASHNRAGRSPRYVERPEFFGRLKNFEAPTPPENSRLGARRLGGRRSRILRILLACLPASLRPAGCLPPGLQKYVSG